MQQGFPGIGYQGARDSDSEHRKQMWAPLLFQIAAYRESSDCSIERKNPFRAQQSPGQRDEVGSLGGWDS